MIYLVLPAYNEEGDIGSLLESAEKTASGLPEELSVIVVDDGSKDNTVEVVKKHSGSVPVKVVSHKKNLGLGQAILTGVKTVCSEASPDDIAVFMDADNTHSPEYINSMYDLIKNGSRDVVIASRYASGGKEIGVTPFRKLLSHGAAWVYGKAFSIPGLRDYTCGYRAYTISILQKSLEKYGDDFITENGFAAPGEMLLKLRRLTDKFGEVPFELHYEKKVGKSKMPKFRTVIRNLVVLMKFR